MEELRTFIALDSNTDLKILLKDTIEKLNKMGFKANWTTIENIHLTFLFLGDLSMHKIAEIAYKIGERISGFPTFIFDVNNLGYFESENVPKNFWFGVSGQQTLYGLYKEIQKAVSLCEVEVQSEEFVPHITVGRVKKHPEHWKQLISSIEFETIKVPVNSVCIYSSTLTKKGPVYEKLYTIDFEGGVIING